MRNVTVLGMVAGLALVACNRSAPVPDRPLPAKTVVPPSPSPPSWRAEKDACDPVRVEDLEPLLGASAKLVGSPKGNECYFFESTTDPSTVRAPGIDVNFLHLQWYDCDRWQAKRDIDAFNESVPGLGDAAFIRQGSMVGVKKGATCFIVSGRILRGDQSPAHPELTLARTVAERL
jgi:hypothetical protein